MLLNQASVKRDGVQDFVSIRATAVVLSLYALFIVGFFLTTPTVTYELWQGLFSNLLVKVFTLLALASIMIHTRIGFWQVLTDYVTSSSLRSVISFFISVIAFGFVATGLFVLWGV